ncbi:MAG: glutamate-5-semialdehyde dehydrogenase [Firmicutes bacterium]|jgi:glutamate-5-semialdehyde dehydrogenase|nr:glutamate-5-semialdehyde dehydrogenase [Bacillota bacterium]MCL5012419.1 glutamate-5-semialdehyde dehydrogenase [Bacillota bacterium]HBQ93973.1 glutamate-5-semialdehyde dehydrogenase [Sulfobacillus sp.]
MLQSMLESGRLAQEVVARSNASQRNKILEKMAELLKEREALILEANRKDLENSSDLPPSLKKRLGLSASQIARLIDGIGVVIRQPDPLGQGEGQRRLANGLSIEAVHVPLGVIGLIFESRPGVAIEATALIVKSGNAAILRGGHEALESIRVLVECWQDAISASGFDRNLVQAILDPDRRHVTDLMHLNGLDLLIPRGGPGLIQRVIREATVPVIETGVGNCHVYVDESADITMAVDIVTNAKVSNPGVCNAAETVLVHRNIAEKFLPVLEQQLRRHDVVLHADSESRSYLSFAMPATEEDFATEYLSLDLAVKVVQDLDDALRHIAQFGTKHSEAIVTNSYSHGERFLNTVDAAVVYWNASTRFSDGYEFGMGGEVGISTQKLHARGPMGLGALTTWKWIARGQGQIRI